MLKKDETNKHLVADNRSSYNSYRMSNKMSETGSQKEDIDEFRHGYGIQYWTDGAHYEGDWHYNKAEGQGTFWHAEGDIYVG